MSTTTLHHFIGGKSVETSSGRYGDIYNPATGAVQGRVGFASVDEVDLAVASAKKASLEWRNTSLANRTRILFGFRELVNKHKDDIARLLTLEHGKVFSDAQGEVQRGLEVIEFACGLAHLLKGEMSENVSTEVDSYSMRQPLGVVAGITPFNFPAMVPMWMYPMAIACGNAFVLKPSERDPSVTNFCA
jgi:malonate-semialdehyde dehydrogenase (acetylating)/methylmalonate-semialdehyde dehydrogenase